MTTAYTLLACVGLTCILKYGSILRWLRLPLCKFKFFKELFSCSLCLGFWSGVAVALFFYFTTWDSLLILLPFVSAPASWLFDSLIGILQTREMILDKELEQRIADLSRNSQSNQRR